MARAVIAQHAKLVVDAAEIGHAKGRYLVVGQVVASDDWQFGWWFGSLGARPDDVWRLNVGVRQVVDRRQLFDVKDEAVFAKSACMCSLALD